jgi:hypothetical protein
LAPAVAGRKLKNRFRNELLMFFAGGVSGTISEVSHKIKHHHFSKQLS